MSVFTWNAVHRLDNIDDTYVEFYVALYMSHRSRLDPIKIQLVNVTRCVTQRIRKKAALIILDISYKRHDEMLTHMCR